MTALRFAIVGAGRIAARHLEVIREMPEITISGICSRTCVNAEKLAQEFNIPVVAANMEGLVRQTSPDALLLLVSVMSVYPVALEALEFGIPLFIEKPAGLNPDETGKLASRALSGGVPNMVGYNRRFYSVFHDGIGRLQKTGKLLGIAIEGHERIDRVRAAGVHPDEVLSAWLYANATHTVDLLRFFGGEVREIRGYARRAREPLVDSIAAVLEFENGVLGQYGAHWHSAAGWRVALYGERTGIEFAPLESGRWVDADGVKGDIAQSAEDARFKPGFFGQMRAFAALVRSGRLAFPATDLQGAHATMLLAQALARGTSA